MGNKQQKEDPQISKEKSTLDKIKMLYKKENKRAEMDDLDSPECSENLGSNGSKKARLDLGTAEIVTKLDVIEVEPKKQVESLNKSPAKKPKKKLRSEVKFKMNSGKRSPVPKLDVKKGSPVPKLDDKKGSPVPVLRTENGSPSQVPDAGNGSTTPNPGTNIRSPVPIIGTDRGSPELVLEVKLKSPDPALEVSEELQNLPVPALDAENGQSGSDFESKSKSKFNVSNKLISDRFDSGTLSPSLKPVKI